MSQTSTDQSPYPTLVFDAQQWNEYTRPAIQRQFMEVILSVALYGTEYQVGTCLANLTDVCNLGTLVLLCGTSIYSLVQ